MRMTKKVLSVVLAVLMVVSMMSVMAVTASATSPDYYVVGTMNSWGISEDYKMAQNVNNTSEYWIQNVPLHSGDAIKVVSSTDGSTVQYWYPDGTDNNYPISEDGYYNVYVAPTGHDTWYYNCIYAEKQSDLNYAAQIGTTKYETLQAAIAAAQSGDTIELLNDIDVTERIVINKDVTITGGGHTLKTTAAAADCMFIYGSKDHKLTISNTVLDGNNLSENAIWTQASGGGSTQSAEVTLTDVTVKKFKGYTYVGAVYLFSNAVGNFNNCVFQNNATPSDSDDGLSGKDIWAGAKATVNINNGSVGDVYLHGGSASVTVDGNATVGTVKYGYTTAGEDSTQMKATVVSGTVENVALGTGIQLAAENFVAASTADLTNAPAGYKWVDSAETGKKTLAPIPYVAQIGDTKYESLKDAFNAVNNNETIVVLADTVIDEKIENTKYSVTLDVSDKTVTVTPWKFEVRNRLYITGSGGKMTGTKGILDNYSMLSISSGVTIESTGTGVAVWNNESSLSQINVNNGATVSAADTAILTEEGNVTVSEGAVVSGAVGVKAQKNADNLINVAGTINATSIGVVVLSGDANLLANGEINAPVGIYTAGANSTATINGGTINATNMAIDIIRGSSVTMNGGAVECTGEACGVFIVEEGSKFTLNDGTISTVDSFGISSNGSAGNEGYEIEINGGIITSENSPAIYQQQDGKLTITGGDITGTSALYIKSGDVKISGGTFKGTQVPATDYEFYGNGTRETGDAIIVDNCNYPGGAPTVSITGGTFTSAAGKAVASYTDKGSKPSATAPGTITGFVSGGNFSNEVPETYCAPGFEPAPLDPQTGMYTVQVDTNPLNQNIGTGIKASQAAAQDGNKFDLPGTLDYTKGRILGVQKKEAIMTDVAGIGIRFIAEAEKATLADAQEYGFEICKTSKTNTPDFAAADGFAAMADPANSAQIVKVNCKGTSNTVVGGGYGDPSADTAYKYVTLAVNDIPSDQGVAVRFYVKDSSGVTHYAKYVRAGDVNMYDGCCTSYANLG